MFHTLRNCSEVHRKFIACVRHLTTTEVSTALRPFYFNVHPDLFGQYPNQRATNENSLQQLSSVIETLQARRFIKPTSLQFYLRDKKCKEGSFRLIKIYINERDIRDVVLTILKTCDLSTDYVDKIPKAPPPRETVRFNTSNIDFSKVNENDPIFGPLVMKHKINEAKEGMKLRNWLEKNYKSALEKFEKNKPLREEVDRLRKDIASQWKLTDVRWDCGWNVTHFRGCLQSFMSLSQQHPEVMHILRGRTLVIFAPFTGISLEGHIMLNSGEVRHNWLDLIKNVRKYDAVLFRIPGFEKSVSQVLRGIKVGRRKFMPKILAGEYERNLQQITTSLSDYKGKRDFPNQWPKSLEDYEIVIETEAGPLMVSPTGQFIVPSSLPGFLLVNFITKHLEEAKEKMVVYKNNKYVERSLVKQCITEFQLYDLQKDDNVTPDLMIKCCERLLEKKSNLDKYLKGVHLNIATYYSVLSDGVVCIPWNWKL